MSPYLYFIPIICLLIVAIIIWRKNRLIIVKKIIEKRKRGDKTEMIELAKRFIGKDCLIYSFDGSHNCSGIIKEVADGAILLENKGEIEAINLDFVIRIREYPKNKKGQRKSVVTD